MGRKLSLRGQIPPNTRERVFFFDSNIQNKGWKIKEAKMQNPSVGRVEVAAVLHTTDITLSTAVLEWDRNTVIGCFECLSAIGNCNDLLDLDHVVVGNLYLSNVDTNYALNYWIVLEELTISPSENIMYQLKEVAQNVDNP